MKLSLYVVRDVALQESWKIAEAKNDTVAMREFQKLMKDREFSEDFILYRIGWYDHEKDEGHFYPAEKVQLSVASEVEE